MKFGKYLIDNKNPAWKNMYLEYDKLKDMISTLEEKQLGPSNASKNTGIALTVPVPTNAAGMPVDRALVDVTQEQFYSFLEQKMRKIEQFTKKMASLFLDYSSKISLNI